MGQNAVLRWQDGPGWLVFSAGHSDEIRALALGVAAADGGIAIVVLGAAGDQVLQDINDLGGPTAYLVDILTEDDTTIRQKLGEGSVILITGDADLSDLRSALYGAAESGIRDAYHNGAVVLVEGRSSMLFGAWVLLGDGELVAGFEWLESALIMPSVGSIADAPKARAVLDQQPSAIAVGLGPGSGVALGPYNQVEPWGNRQITIALGRDYQT